jgi:hypothetical protein
MAYKDLFSFEHREQNFSKFLVATIVFYLFKTAFWPITYLFFVCYCILIFVFFSKFKWKFKFGGFIVEFLAPFILAGIIIAEFLFNGHFSKTALKDILLLSVLFSLFYFLYWNSRVLKKDIPIKFTINLIIFNTAVISVLNLIFQIGSSIVPTTIITHLNISVGSTIANDYNFFSLFILFGLLIINAPAKNNNYLLNWYSFRLKLFLNLLFILNILFSSSRRGIIVLMVLLLFYLSFSVRTFIKNFRYDKLLKYVAVFLVSIFLLFLAGIVIYRIVPKQRLSIILYRYATLFGTSNYKSIEESLSYNYSRVPKDKKYLIDKSSLIKEFEFWDRNPTPGTNISYVETPYGPGIKVVKSGDPTDFSLSYIGPRIIYFADHTYKISFKIKFINGDFNSFYLGWWVNDGAKGISNTLVLDKETSLISDGWYSCVSEYTFIDNHVGIPGFINSVKDHTSFIISDFELIDLDFNPDLPRFEFEYKGHDNLSMWLNKVNSPWLNTNLVNNGDFSHNLAFWKYSSNSLTIKATNVDSIKCASIGRGIGDGGDWSLYYAGRDIDFKANNEYQISFKMKP